VRKPADYQARPHAYGLLLLLILASLSFQVAAPDHGWARFVITVLQAGTLVLALWAAQARKWEFRIGAAFAAVIVIAAAATLLTSGDLDRPVARISTLLMTALAPPAVALGVVRDLRQNREVTMRTMFGVLCIYLLVGMFFAFGFALIDVVSSKPFFAQVSNTTPSDYLYFSFATITTVGYGDLTAHTDLGRSLAITEALVGQIYLVTVVALIVSNIGRGPGARRRHSRGEA
jgi:Ion channel